jgi:glucokinase
VSEQLLGVDVGGTKIAVAALQDGALGEPHVVPTEQAGGQELIDQIVAAVEAVRADDTVAVGVGVPSVIDLATGRVKSSVNVPLKDVRLREVLGERLGLPVFVENDANVAAFAEAHDGDRLIHRNLVMLTVGTGVGGGIVIDGRLFRGSTGAGAEIGHTIIGLDLRDGAPSADGFPRPGSLEFLAAGRAIDHLGIEYAREHPESALGRIGADGREVTGTDVVEQAHAGDAGARRLLEVHAQRLGVGIANAINVFDPEVVVIGGGAAAAAGELMLGPAREAAARFVLPGVGERTEIKPARYGMAAGVLGAALIARHEVRELQGAQA